MFCCQLHWIFCLCWICRSHHYPKEVLCLSMCYPELPAAFRKQVVCVVKFTCSQHIVLRPTRMSCSYHTLFTVALKGYRDLKNTSVILCKEALVSSDKYIPYLSLPDNATNARSYHTVRNAFLMLLRVAQKTLRRPFFSVYIYVRVMTLKYKSN